MTLPDWKPLFALRILLRGRDYYESELVKIETMDEKHIEGTVEGTEPYPVKIRLGKDRVTEMTCGCPYAADGNNCKHMAAMLFAADAEKTEKESLSEIFLQSAAAQKATAEKELETAVGALPEEKARAYLLEAARQHEDLRRRILMSGKESVTQETKRRWKTDLAEMTREAADRHGFIDYRHAYGYTHELGSYLSKTIGPLLENRLVTEAFELVCLVFSEAVDQPMDDSDGGLSVLAGRCGEYWEELARAPEADQPAMFRWFGKEIRRLKGKVGAEILRTVVYDLFTDPSVIPEILAMLDREIAGAERYALEDLVGKRVLLMERMGASAEEIEAYKRKYWDLPFIRKQKLDQLEADKKWREALELIRTCEKMDAKDVFLLRDHSARRLRILKTAGTEKAYREALERHVFTYPQEDLTWIEEYKRTVPPDQWPKALEKLLQSDCIRNVRREFQIREGLLDQMMAEIEKRNNPYELRKYEKVLRKAFPLRVRDLLIRQIDEEMRGASTRSAYAHAVERVKQLYGYPDGRRKAAELAAGWRRDLPRRSAMLEELEEAKL